MCLETSVKQKQQSETWSFDSSKLWVQQMVCCFPLHLAHKIYSTCRMSNMRNPILSWTKILHPKYSP
jgi:hypothetical protein